MSFMFQSRKYKLSCADNAFLAQSLLHEAELHSSKDKIKLASSFRRAVESLCKYPLQVRDKHDAAQLIGVGDFLAMRCEAILAQHIRSQQQQLASGASSTLSAAAASMPVDEFTDELMEDVESKENEINRTNSNGNNKKRKQHETLDNANDSTPTTAPSNEPAEAPKAYKPIRGTPAHALLVTLVQHPQQQVEWAEWQALATPLLRAKKTAPSSDLTAASVAALAESAAEAQARQLWNGLKKLQTEQLCQRRSKTDKHYTLTAVGQQLAQQLAHKMNGKSKKKVRSNSDTAAISGTDKQPTLHSVLSVALPVKSSSVASSIVAAMAASSVTAKPTAATSSQSQSFVDDDDMIDMCDERSKQPTAPVENSASTNNNSNSNMPVSRSRAARTRLPLSDFNLVLLVDTRERKGQKDRSYIIDHLKRRHIPSEVRSLPIGDFAWIVRHKSTGVESMCDLIIERKKMTDLCSSIMDGRLAEQRTRLLQTKLKRVCILVEGSLQAVFGVPITTVQSVMASLQACYGFMLLECNQLDTSIHTLCSMHHAMQTHLQETGVFSHELQRSANSNSNDRDLPRAMAPSGEGESYESFALRMRKSVTDSQHSVFAVQLRMIKGVSPAVAAAIATRYPTPRHLIEAYVNTCRTWDQECRMLSTLTCSVKGGAQERVIGKALSSRLAEFFRSNNYHDDAHHEDREQQLHLDEAVAQQSKHRLHAHLTDIDKQQQAFDAQTKSRSAHHK